MRSAVAVLFASMMGVGACTLTHNLDDLVGAPVVADQADGSGNSANDAAGGSDARLGTSDSAAGDASPTFDGADGSQDRYRAAVLADLPVGYWRLGEGAANNIANDELGAHPGTYSGNVVRGLAGALVGNPNTAAKFGQGQVTIGDVFDFAARQPFAVEAWFAYDHGIPDASYTEKYIVAKLDGTGGYHMYLSSLRELAWDRAGSSGFDGAAVGFFPSTQFHHAVATYDGSACRLYYDGTLVDNNPCTRNVTNTSAPLTIGAEPGESNGAFDGIIDEVALYDHILDDTAVRIHYEIGAGRR